MTIFKRITWLSFFPKSFVLYIKRFVSTSLTNTWKAFFKFRICFRIFDQKSKIFQKNCEAWILMKLQCVYYASPTSGEAYRDRRLTTNFELWVEIFCADMFPCEDSKTVSVCLSVHLYPEKRNHPGFVNISPTLVIDTSMERPSRVLHHGNPEMWNFFQKVRNWLNWILSVHRVSVCWEKKSPWLRQYQSYISNWYVNGKVFTSTTTWEPIFFFFQKKVWNWIWLVLKSWNQHSSRSHLYVDIGDAAGCIVVPLRVDI